jgi:hypothetical protein
LHLGIEAGSLWAECHIFIPQIAGVLVIIWGRRRVWCTITAQQRRWASCEYYLGKKSTKPKV